MYLHTSTYMFIHLNTCSCIYIHVHTSTYIIHLLWIGIQLHAFTSIYMHVNTIMSMHLHTYIICIYTYLRPHLHLFTPMLYICIYFHPFAFIYIHLHTFNHLHNTSIYTHVHPFTSFCISLQISSPPDLSRVLHVYFSIFYTLKSECKTSGRWITNWIIVDKYFWFENDQQLDDYSCVFPIAGFQDQQEITIPHLLPSAEVWFYGQCRVFSFGTHGPGGSAGHGVCCMLLGFVFLSETWNCCNGIHGQTFGWKDERTFWSIWN